MRLLIQRVLKGGVTVDGKSVGKIGKGMHILLGVTYGDTEADIQMMAERVLKLNLWEAGGKSTATQKSWNSNVVQSGFDIMVVSQFTLYGHLKGNKPDFHMALEHDLANDLYLKFVNYLKSKYVPERIQTGSFGHYMNVELENDGPVAIVLESPPKPEPAAAPKAEAKTDAKEELKAEVKKA